MRLALALFWILLAHSLWGQESQILEIENRVEKSQGRASHWSEAAIGDTLQLKERVRTKRKSRAMVQISDLYTMRMDQFTTVEITPRLIGSSKPTLNVSRGITFIFSREKEGEIDVTTPTANAALRGTQLVVEVEEDGLTKVAVLEGQVDLSNDFGQLQLKAGEAGEVEKGKPPRKTAVIEARNLVQWALYYPGVFRESAATLQNHPFLAQSVAAYLQGDPLMALKLLPEKVGKTVQEELYHAQILLAVGQVDEASSILQKVPKNNGSRLTLETLIAAVTLRPFQEEGIEVELRVGDGVIQGVSAELALAESYLAQARHDLVGAREKARLAVRLDPQHGYAWTRLAELEFSFGEHHKSKQALGKAHQLTPRNPQIYALQGFILAARNQLEGALRMFETAIQIDGALGNAWLGRGLVKIRMKHLEEGRQDLQAATTVEPTRALFHSYLGKAFGELGKGELAGKDLLLARQLDPLDPTPWLYSAIENQKDNRFNRAIADLGKSVSLNDNRRVYRSQLLLDQDRAVRSSNLASIFQNAGLAEVAVREATRAVEADYTSASAHLFLANSFDALRDPRRVSLRFETAYFNELLLANLFAPVGGGPLSQFVSQQEYSKLFRSDGLGASFLGEWTSEDEVFGTASIFGSHRNVEFGIDVNYRNASGIRQNNGIELLEISAQAKWEATPDDIVYFLGKWQELSAGDNFQVFDNQPLEPFVDFEESQRPGLLLAGWNHRWKPGVHTLLLGGRLGFEQRVSNPQSEQLRVEREPFGLVPGFFDLGVGGLEFSNSTLNAEIQNAIAQGTSVPGQIGPDGESLFLSPTLIDAVEPFLSNGDLVSKLSGEADASSFDFFTEREFEVYSAEFQQVFQTEKNTVLFGGRAQGGEIRARSRLFFNRPEGNLDGFGSPASEDSFRYDFARFNAYFYDYWNPIPELTLIGGVSWDWIQRPTNFRNPPLSSETQIDEDFSGRAAFTYTPNSWISLRGAYSEGLGGLAFDESVRLEPVQLAGFNQSFRTVISESLVGSVEAPGFETWGLSASGSLPTKTWWGVRAQNIVQNVERDLGIFTGFTLPNQLIGLSPVFFPDNTPENFEYEELQLTATLNQLIGEDLAVGARYRFTDSSLSRALPELEFSSFEEADLHELSLFADWNSASGLFARVEGNWFRQELNGVVDVNQNALEGDQFWQFNASLGYRFRDGQGEVRVSALNLLAQDYQLSPLSPFLELPRERTFVVRCRWNF